MADQIDPMVLQYLARTLGPRVNENVIEGALLVKGIESMSKQMLPQQPDMLMQYLMRQLGNRFTKDHLLGATAIKGMETMSKQLRPPQLAQAQIPQQPMPGMNPLMQPGQKPRRPAQPQAGGQKVVNESIRGAGPLRSNTTEEQLQALAAFISSPQFGMQLAKMPRVPPRGARPVQGIPGVPGPQFG